MTKIFVLLIFVCAYALIMIFRKKDIYIAFAACILLLLSGLITPQQAIGSINFNVLGIFFGMMVLSELFVFSGVPAYLAVKFASISKNVGIAFLSLCVLTGAISSVVENVVTIMIIAPIAFAIARKLDTSPVPLFIGVAVSSNLQGCATLVGDSPSMILGTSSGMSFNDFFWMHNRPGITFAVELGAVFSFIVLYLFYRKFKKPVAKIEAEGIKSLFPSILMALLIAALIFISFIPDKPAYTIALVCPLFAAIGIIWLRLFHKEPLSLIRDLDWRTFFFLIGVFVLVGSLSAAGIIDMIAQAITNISGNNAFLAYSIIVWMSVLLSAFIDNIPFTIAMIPVAKIVAQSFGISAYPFLFGLLIGTCLGGNITPIGASANIAAIGFLKRKGYHVSFKEFAKIGFPFTIAAVSVAYIFIWLVWAK